MTIVRHVLRCFCCTWLFLAMPAVALTQISAYSTHKNVYAVRTIMEAIRTAYAQNRTWFPHVSNYTWGKRSRKAREYCERKARIVCEELIYFAESFDEPGDKGALEMRHSFLYFSSLLRISAFLYANMSSTCVTCGHILKSWARPLLCVCWADADARNKLEVGSKAK